MKDTRQRILSSGLDMLTSHGFAGVTLGALAEQTGLSKSGLFAHFGSKEEVQLSLLEEMTAVGAASFVAPAMLLPQGSARLRAVVRGWLGWSERAGLHGGCPVAAGMFEFDDAELTHPVRQRLLAMEQRWRGFLVQLVSEAVATGELRKDLDAEQFVWELCGIYLNHHVSHRFLRDGRADRQAWAAFESLLDRSRRSSRHPRAAKPAVRTSALRTAAPRNRPSALPAKRTRVRRHTPKP